ncbi:MAG TPA: hypothetical protein VJ818_01925 [Actinomycetota bacterium]|nr:hypothetical protein [Actinomycetota bacterium]
MSDQTAVARAKAHVPKLVKNADVHPHQGFNKWLAVKLTDVVGTMWCAYAFVALALVVLPDAIKGGTLTLVQWVSQTFIQLVMLSVIMVGQNVISAGQDARAEADHETLGAIHLLDTAIHDLTLEVKAINERQLALMQPRDKG